MLVSAIARFTHLRSAATDVLFVQRSQIIDPRAFPIFSSSGWNSLDLRDSTKTRDIKSVYLFINIPLIQVDWQLHYILFLFGNCYRLSREFLRKLSDSKRIIITIKKSWRITNDRWLQLNIKAVTGACKLIDGCSLELYFCHTFRGINNWHMVIKSIQLHGYRDGLAMRYRFYFTLLLEKQMFSISSWLSMQFYDISHKLVLSSSNWIKIKKTKSIICISEPIN